MDITKLIQVWIVQIDIFIITHGEIIISILCAIIISLLVSLAFMHKD